MKHLGPNGEVVEIFIGEPCECGYCQDCVARRVANSMDSPVAGEFKKWIKKRRQARKLPAVRQPANS